MSVVSPEEVEDEESQYKKLVWNKSVHHHQDSEHHHLNYADDNNVDTAIELEDFKEDKSVEPGLPIHKSKSTNVETKVDDESSQSLLNQSVAEQDKPQKTDNVKESGTISVHLEPLKLNENLEHVEHYHKHATMLERIQMKLKPYLGILFMILGSVFFSFMSTFIKLSSNNGMPPFELLFARNFFQMLFSGVILVIQRESPLGKKGNRIPLMLRGFLAFFGQAGYFYTLSYLDVSTAVTLSFTAPVLSTLLAVPMLKETFTRYDLIGVCLCFVGVLLITKPLSLIEQDFDMNRVIGITISLCAACFAAVRQLNQNSIHPFL